jgi:hypothetical protein
MQAKPEQDLVHIPSTGTAGPLVVIELHLEGGKLFVVTRLHVADAAGCTGAACQKEGLPRPPLPSAAAGDRSQGGAGSTAPAQDAPAQSAPLTSSPALATHRIRCVRGDPRTLRMLWL